MRSVLDDSLILIDDRSLPIKWKELENFSIYNAGDRFYGTIVVGNVLYRYNEKLDFRKCINIEDNENREWVKLSKPEQFDEEEDLAFYALTAFRGRYIILTGGVYDWEEVTKTVLMFDTLSESWIMEPALPELP